MDHQERRRRRGVVAGGEGADSSGADSAFYDEQALTWADQADIQFAVSADISKALSATVVALPKTAWQPYLGREGPISEWALKLSAAFPYAQAYVGARGCLARAAVT